MYNIDKSHLQDNVLILKIDDILIYHVELTRLPDYDDIWTFNFISPPVNNSFEYILILVREFFESGLLEKNEVKNIFVLIEGNDREDVDKKTDSFIGFIKDDWSLQIIQDPEIQIEGGYGYINHNTNSIFITKKEKEIITEVNIVSDNLMKFCPNCGLENNNYKFCPNCGTNLKQA
jgi:hypothetical protein